METIEGKLDSYIRNKFNERVGPFLDVKFPKISPNKWTTIGFLTALFVSFLIAFRLGLFWGSFTLISALLDAVDGSVARARKKTTSFGAVIDDVADRFGEGFYFVAIYLLEPSLSVMVAGITSVFTSYSKATAKANGFNLSAGKIFGRPCRIFLLGLLMFVSPWLAISQTLWLIVGLNLFTLAKRMYEVKKQSG